MSDEPAFDPDLILAALSAHGAKYVVVGGLALAAHGVIRATADLDLVVAADWDNAEALSLAMAAVDALDLDDRSSAITRESLVRRVDRRLRTRHGDVHLLHQVEGVPRYEELVPAAVFDLGGVAVPVAQLDDLTAMKRAGGRAKDAVDLAELEALGSGEDEPLA
jgi:hypothetical protein